MSEQDDECEYTTDTRIKCPTAQEATALRARVAKLEAALRMMYDKYENGDGCYEDPDVCSGYLGSAVKLSDEEEQQVYALLEKQP